MMREAMRKTLWLCMGLALSVVWGQEAKAPSDQELKATSARGKMLAEYDVAAWHATDAVEALKADHAAAPMYLAHKVAGKWEVVFGRMTPDGNQFLIVYRALQGAKPEEFSAKKVNPPLDANGFYLDAAKATATAGKDFGRQTRPYNLYVLPSEDGQLYVYFLPGQTSEGVFPLGADVRYTITLDGGTIVSKRQMHKNIIDAKPSTADGQVAAGHKHADDNEIEDSDVFHVLTRTPAMPEYVGTPDKHLYEIKTDGGITRVR